MEQLRGRQVEQLRGRRGAVPAAAPSVPEPPGPPEPVDPRQLPYGEGDRQAPYAVFTLTPVQQIAWAVGCFAYALCFVVLLPGTLGVLVWLAVGALLTAARVRGTVELRPVALVARGGLGRAVVPWHEMRLVEVRQGVLTRRVVVHPHRARRRVLPIPVSGPGPLADPRFDDRVRALQEAARAG